MAAWADESAAVAATYADELAAVVVEPVLQGAGGMHVYPPPCVRVLREVGRQARPAAGPRRDRHRVRPDRDDVRRRAAGVAPDVMCVGKALTGGYLTLARRAVHAGRRRAASRPRSPAR